LTCWNALFVLMTTGIKPKMEESAIMAALVHDHERDHGERLHSRRCLNTLRGSNTDLSEFVHIYLRTKASARLIMYKNTTESRTVPTNPA